MNDITKARAFLSAVGSDLQHLVSFGLMLATAEQRYRDLQLQRKSNKEVASAKEVDVLLEVAVLRYLKKNNRLPGNVTDAFVEGVTLDRKRELATAWING